VCRDRGALAAAEERMTTDPCSSPRWVVRQLCASSTNGFPPCRGAPRQERLPAMLTGCPACGDYRRRPASRGDCRPTRARDLRGMKKSRRSTTPRQSTKHVSVHLGGGSRVAAANREVWSVRRPRRSLMVIARPLSRCCCGLAS
jgi:hypothetical protein